MPEAIDLCDSCDEDGCEQDFKCDEDEDGCEQDFEHYGKDEDGCEQDYCEEVYEHDVWNQFLLSDDNDEASFVAKKQTNDDGDTSIAANELQIIDLSRSLHDVAPWIAKLPFDVEFDGHQGNFDI